MRVAHGRKEFCQAQMISTLCLVFGMTQRFARFILLL